METQKYRNSSDVAKITLNRKFIPINTYTKKQE